MAARLLDDEDEIMGKVKRGGIFLVFEYALCAMKTWWSGCINPGFLDFGTICG
jgi:hypothetical protein